jgi:peroxiredoxin Q/BCP
MRTFGATLAAAGTALVNLVTGGRDRGAADLAPGDQAPDFTLAASDGRTYTLGEFRGRSVVVIAWFPKAFTAGCTTQCRSIGANADRLRAFDAAVFGATLDSAAVGQAFAESTAMGIPVLSDTDGRVARDYGVLGRTGLPNRWTFYIGLDGRILEIDRGVHVGSHGADIASTLERLGVARRP